MKKVYYKMLCFVFIATLLFTQYTPFNSKALSVATVSVTQTSGYRSDIVNISVKITNNSKMQACGLTLLYDDNVLEVVLVEKGSILSGNPVINTSKLGKIVFSYAATSPLTAGGSLLNVAFMIKSNATFGESHITCNLTELSDGDFNNLDANVIEGQIVVIAPVLDAPNQIDVLNCDDTSVELLWEGNEYASGYNIYINDVLYNDEPYTDNTVRIQNLSPDTEYQIQISTLNYLTESDKSSVITAMTTKPKCFVVFYSWDETILDVQEVEYGSSAIAPVPAYRDGYHFLGWNESFDYITDYKEIQPLYEKNSCLHENTEVRNASASTCAVHGYSGDTYCLDCGELVATGTELPLAAHQYVSTITEPTPSVQGYTTHTCSVCGNSYIDTYTDYVGADAPQIVVSSGRAVLGNNINVTVALKNNPGIASAKLKVTYNSEVFTLINVTDGGILGTSVHKPQMASPYTLSWVNDTATTNFTANGTIATLTFAVDENAEVGNYPVTVSYSYDDYDIYNVDVEPVRFAVVNGNIEVTDVIIGDVNGDGKVNNLDRVVLTRYLADWDDYPESVIDMTAADVNCDGKVNNLDRVILTRYLADWDDYPELPYTG